ncbi:hypothetical protein ACHAWF_015707 [Thalassiosira exigua]
MTMRSTTSPAASLLLLALSAVLLRTFGRADGFLLGSPSAAPAPPPAVGSRPRLALARSDGLLPGLAPLCAGENGDDVPTEPIAVAIDAALTEPGMRRLFAWIKCAFDYDESDRGDGDVYAYYYNNIELAIAASFGDNLPEESLPAKLMEMALKKEGLTGSEEPGKEWEEALVGDVIGRRERESASLGAMGAAQWTGQWMTRPHSLLDVRNFTSVDLWIRTLPRGCKRTLKKATPEAQNFTVTSKPIRGGDAAPHSSYAHFRCVVQHEVRLLSNRYGASTSAFVNALAEAISRYMGTTRMAGNIREYRDSVTNRVIGFAHEVSKGRVMRGQWFYCDDVAAKRYVWFHSVRDLVRRAIDDERIDTVDLGPSGSDAFTELKEKYGFESVVDWPAMADYTSGDFIYEDDQNEKDMGDDMFEMIEQQMQRQAARETRRDDKD